MKCPAQRSLHCQCGNRKILAMDLCATCYTLKRQKQEYFGGLREQVWSGMSTDAASVRLFAPLRAVPHSIAVRKVQPKH
jgi:hypothetical protein